MTYFPAVFLFIFCFLLSIPSLSQTPFSKYNTIKGSESPARNYNVTFYDLNLEIDPDQKTISGFNRIIFTATNALELIQVDLSHHYIIDSIFLDHSAIKFQRDSSHLFIKPKSEILKGKKGMISIYYSGNPPVGKNLPWDGGFTWNEDSLQRPWIGVACESLGSSSWWPCKDIWSEEPDSMQLTFTFPTSLQCISNGRKIEETKLDNGKKKVSWKVHYPINSYNATVYLGNFIHFSDTLKRENQTSLALDYYVLDYNLQRAKNHFQQVKLILSTFEKLFGQYPFQNDGYALVEAPYWGMEHQSAIAYGNNYKNNLLKFDYIIVHETAHEWWGNSVTAKDHAQMWIHEAFATYSEALLVEKLYNLEVATAYLFTQKPRILNEKEIEKPVGVNFHNYTDTDMYFKGSWMLHTIRNIVNNDSVWFNLIKAFAIEKRLKIIDREDVVLFFNNYTRLDLSPIFSQYLNTPNLPVLVYNLKKTKGQTIIGFKWEKSVPGFKMPVEVLINDKPFRISPTETFNYMKVKGKVKSFVINQKKFLAESKAIND